MKKRYEKNIPSLSHSECELLTTKHVCVIGCGGLGGYVVELLARLGVGRITVVDPDHFTESNLNRQLFSTEENLGVLKVLAARDRIRVVNPNTVLNAVPHALNEGTAAALLSGCDVVVDALDNVPSRLILANHCQKLGIPLIHGAAEGWCGQTTTFTKGKGMELLYPDGIETEVEPEMGTLPFATAMTASIQCAEAVKLLTGRTTNLSGRLLQFDLLTQEYEYIPLD